MDQKSLTLTPSLGATMTTTTARSPLRRDSRPGLSQPHREESFPERVDMPALLHGVTDADMLAPKEEEEALVLATLKTEEDVVSIPSRRIGNQPRPREPKSEKRPS